MASGAMQQLRNRSRIALRRLVIGLYPSDIYMSRRYAFAVRSAIREACPQRLKPLRICDGYGTAEALP